MQGVTADINADFHYYSFVDHLRRARDGARYASDERHELRFAHRAGPANGQAGSPARALSDGIPSAGDGRAHRQSERRLEGTRPLVGERHAGRLAYRAGARGSGPNPAFPAAAEPAGQVTRRQDSCTVFTLSDFVVHCRSSASCRGGDKRSSSSGGPASRRSRAEAIATAPICPESGIQRDATTRKRSHLPVAARGHSRE